MPALPMFQTSIEPKIEDVTESMRKFAAMIESRYKPSMKLLPKGLADDILKAAEVERKLLNQRIEALQKDIAEIEKQKAALRKDKQKSQPAIPGGRGASVATQETIGISRSIRIKDEAIKRRKNGIVHLQSRLGDIRKVERAARAGKVSAIMAITADWQNSNIAVMMPVSADSEQPDGDKLDMER